MRFKPIHGYNIFCACISQRYRTKQNQQQPIQQKSNSIVSETTNSLDKLHIRGSLFTCGKWASHIRHKTATCHSIECHFSTWLRLQSRHMHKRFSTRFQIRRVHVCCLQINKFPLSTETSIQRINLTILLVLLFCLNFNGL